LQLALEMQAARGGLSLVDIQGKFCVGRRTAMRMRDALLRNFPQVEEVETGDRTKRWRIPVGTLDRLIAFTAEELAALESAVRLLERDNRESDAAELVGLLGKLRAVLKPNITRKVEPDIEALLEATGLAARPGPRPKIDVAVIEDLHLAILSNSKVRIRYRNRSAGKVNLRLVHPYGFLHGHRNYLVGWHEHPKANDVALFALPNIEGVEITDEVFVREPGFSLDDFAAKAFGVYQGEPINVVWRFTTDAAVDAADFVFHPSQVLEPQDDGSLIVRFTAAGELEMAWHLYCWGDKVEVLEPKHLAEMVANHRVAWPGRL